jgi:hypothetical protein
MVDADQTSSTARERKTVVPSITGGGGSNATAPDSRAAPGDGVADREPEHTP